MHHGVSGEPVTRATSQEGGARRPWERGTDWSGGPSRTADTASHHLPTLQLEWVRSSGQQP